MAETMTAALTLELTDDLRFILGHPCFACINYAKALRLLGVPIKSKAEDEQATVIHWMLTHYLADNVNWRAACEVDLKRAYAAAPDTTPNTRTESKQ